MSRNNLCYFLDMPVEVYILVHQVNIQILKIIISLIVLR
jgi:hypothetical protein